MDFVIPNIGGKSRVCLQTWMGTFVCAEDGGGSTVVVNRPAAREWETFELHRVDADHVTLQSHNGQYLCAEHGGGTIIAANRTEAREWERFALFVDVNGLVFLKAHNGQFVCADHSGVLMADRNEPKEWEAFRVVAPAIANDEQTRIEVHVYKIISAPLWHTGTVINDREYYFHTNNQVETCSPRGMALDHHRTLVRLVPGSLDTVNAILRTVMERWNGTRYDVGGHNCNFFTDNLLKSLGAPGLDQEYLDASGLARGIRQIPGGAVLQELVVKWPIADKRLDEAFMADLMRLARAPQDILRELERAFGRIAGGWRIPW